MTTLDHRSGFNVTLGNMGHTDLGEVPIVVQSKLLLLMLCDRDTIDEIVIFSQRPTIV